jgi:hypothetical protein
MQLTNCVTRGNCKVDVIMADGCGESYQEMSSVDGERLLAAWGGEQA